MVVGIVVVTFALASFIVVWRASRENYLEAVDVMGSVDDDTNIYLPTLNEIDGLDNFAFLTGYGVELALALLLYYPIMGTVLFSGLLGCGRLPMLGGRPREMFLERLRQERKEQKSALRSVGGRTRRTCGPSTVGTNTIATREELEDFDNFENEDGMWSP